MSVTNFLRMWELSVERFPRRIALMSASTGSRTTYAELQGEAAAVAGRLTSAGVAEGELVGLRTGDRRRFCVALLGCWLAGAVPVPLSASAPDDYVTGMTERLGVTIVVIDDDALEDGLGLTGAPSRTSRPTAPGAGLAYVMHTSGSTGRPKAVALSHRAVAAYCTAFTGATGLCREDRFLQVAPLTFDVVFEELLPIWGVGGMVVLAPGTPEDPRRLLAEIERRGVTVAELTTVYWRLLVRYLRSSAAPVPSCLRLLLVGGEQASEDLLEESLRLGLPLAHVYGVTEAGITSTVEFFDRSRPVEGVSVGPPLRNSTVHVVDEACRPVPPGEAGEVWIGGESLAEGYLGSPEETARCFVDVRGSGLPTGRFYRTGDAGKLSVSGKLEILGRLDDQVKVNGIRVDLAEVEVALGASPLVAASAAVVVGGPDGAHRLHGFVVPADGVDPDSLLAGMRRALGERIPRHLVPESIVAVGALPVTAHGKVDRQALTRGIGAENAERSAATGTTTERLVRTAWMSAIGRTPSDIDQNFIDAGGDSRALLALVIALEEAGAVVTPTDCLTHPTVRALAAFLDDGGSSAAEQGGSPASPPERERRQAFRESHLRRRRAANRGPS